MDTVYVLKHCCHTVASNTANKPYTSHTYTAAESFNISGDRKLEEKNEKKMDQSRMKK